MLEKLRVALFVDVQKAATVPGEEPWWYTRTSDERCEVGVTDGFKVGVGLCQGSAMNPFMFVVSEAQGRGLKVRSRWKRACRDGRMFWKEEK